VGPPPTLRPSLTVWGSSQAELPPPHVSASVRVRAPQLTHEHGLFVFLAFCWADVECARPCPRVGWAAGMCRSLALGQSLDVQCCA